jgi:transposase
MSILTNNSIRSLLNITDKNISFNENSYLMKKVKYVDTHVFNATLTYVPKACPKCGCLKNGHNIIKNGFKSSSIRLARISNIPAVLNLRKQRYICKDCESTFIAKTNIVSPYCFISNSIKNKIIVDLTDVKPFKSVAKDNDVSINTVLRTFHNAYSTYRPDFNYLPSVLSCDEFKSVKSVDSAMSFVFIDGTNSNIIDIIPDRRLFVLERYFMKFTKKARCSVKFFVCDMYSPYISLAKNVFPNAKIVIDPFHIVQNFNRAFNMTRVQIMKNFKTDSHEYRALKRYWKLLLKSNSKLNSSYYHHFTCFNSWKSEADVIGHILDFDDTLKNCYNFIQSINLSVSIKDFNLFNQCLNDYLGNNNLSDKVSTALNTGIEYLEYIKNTMDCNFSNGRIEGINNKIKLIKRVSYGYRSFDNFRLRIMLCFHKFKFKGFENEIAAQAS